MSTILQQHLTRRENGTTAGIYSVCSAHPWVIRAAAEQAAEDDSLLLVEATSVRYETQDPSLFAVPPGFSHITAPTR